MARIWTLGLISQNFCRVKYYGISVSNRNHSYDEDMGPPTFVEPSFKSQRAATALANLNKGEHKLNRKSGEKMQKVRHLILD